MPFTTPKSWSTGNVLTATDMNTYIRDNVSWLATDKPTCRAKRTSVQSISNASYNVVLLDAEDWDNASMHSTTTNTGRLTVPSGGGGKYYIGWSIFWATNVNGYRQTALRKNGTALLNVDITGLGSGVSGSVGVMADTSVAGDYYELLVWQNSGGALNIDAVSVPVYFWASWFGT